MKHVLLALAMILGIIFIYYFFAAPDLSVATGDNIFVDTLSKIVDSIGRIGESITRIISKAIPRL